MKSATKLFLIAILFFIKPDTALNAQLNLSMYEIGLSGGPFIYQGDLTPQNLGSYKTMKPQLALMVYRIVTSSFSIRAMVTRGNLYGNDAMYSNPSWRRERNFIFTTPVTELSVQGVWSILPNLNSKFKPYVFAGLGLSLLNIRRNFSNVTESFLNSDPSFTSNLAIDISHSLPKFLPIIPIGIGTRYILNEKLSLIGETNFRITSTDYLDGFSKSADPLKKDFYFSHNIGVIYVLGKKTTNTKCPIIKKII